jgi:hypothetical protein
MYIGVCRECKQPIQGRNSTAVYCSSACKERRPPNRKRETARRPITDIVADDRRGPRGGHAVA